MEYECSDCGIKMIWPSERQNCEVCGSTQIVDITGKCVHCKGKRDREYSRICSTCAEKEGLR